MTTLATDVTIEDRTCTIAELERVDPPAAAQAAVSRSVSAARRHATVRQRHRLDLARCVSIAVPESYDADGIAGVHHEKPRAIQSALDRRLWIIVGCTGRKPNRLDLAIAAISSQFRCKVIHATGAVGWYIHGCGGRYSSVAIPGHSEMTEAARGRIRIVNAR